MDSKELRIGNLINDNSLYTQVISDHLINDEYYDGLKGCLPIPLTEEWLIKFGFEKDDVEDYCKLIGEDTFLAVDLIGLECHIGVSVEWGRVPSLIEHVHQLQNLYFALTGEELTIKQ